MAIQSDRKSHDVINAAAALDDWRHYGRSITVLFDGVIIYAQSQRDPSIALIAKDMVKKC